MFSEILQTIISLFVLTCLEIILSIDNILFISLVSENLEKKRQKTLKYIGIILALSGRILLLFSLNWLTHINYPLFTLYNFKLSFKDLIMISGGIYLILFSIIKLFDTIKCTKKNVNKKASSFISALIIILFGDSLFSFDSVLAAITIGHNLTAMIIAIIFSSIFLLFSINTISNFIEKHSNIKILALSFLFLIGISLTTNGFHYNFSGIQMFIIMSFAALVQFFTVKKTINKG